MQFQPVNSTMESGLEGMDISNATFYNFSQHSMEETTSHHAFINDSVTMNTCNRSDLPKNPFDYYTLYRDDTGRVAMMLSQPSSVVGILLGILGILLNIVCMLALSQVRTKWTCLYRIMLSLMLADMLTTTGYVAHIFHRAYMRYYFAGLGPWDIRVRYWCTFTVVKAFTTMGMNVTLLNLMVMAIDHFTAILYPMQYKRVLSVKRSNALIITIWIIAAITGFSDFFSPLWNMDDYRVFRRFNFCEFIWISKHQEEYTTFAIALLCACVMVTLYMSIYCAARDKVRNVAMTEKDGSIRFRHSSNKRGLVTTFLILGTFILCWLPMFCYQVILLMLVKFRPEHLHSIDRLMLIDAILVCVVLLNSICDPIIYAIRIREVRLGFLVLLGKLAPKSLKHKFTDPQSTLNYRRYSITYGHTERRGTLCSGLENGNTEDDSGASLSQPRADSSGKMDPGCGDSNHNSGNSERNTDTTSERETTVQLINEPNEDDCSDCRRNSQRAEL